MSRQRIRNTRRKIDKASQRLARAETEDQKVTSLIELDELRREFDSLIAAELGRQENLSPAQARFLDHLVSS